MGPCPWTWAWSGSCSPSCLQAECGGASGAGRCPAVTESQGLPLGLLLPVNSPGTGWQGPPTSPYQAPHSPTRSARSGDWEGLPWRSGPWGSVPCPTPGPVSTGRRTSPPGVMMTDGRRGVAGGVVESNHISRQGDPRPSHSTQQGRSPPIAPVRATQGLSTLWLWAPSGLWVPPPLSPHRAPTASGAHTSTSRALLRCPCSESTGAWQVCQRPLPV